MPTPSTPRPKALIHRFELGRTSPSETWARPGKAEWPNMIRLEMSADRALEIAQQLIEQVRAKKEHVGLTLLGELSEDPDE